MDGDEVRRRFAPRLADVLLELLADGGTIEETEAGALTFRHPAGTSIVVPAAPADPRVDENLVSRLRRVGF